MELSLNEDVSTTILGIFLWFFFIPLLGHVFAVTFLSPDVFFFVLLYSSLFYTSYCTTFLIDPETFILYCGIVDYF